MKGRYEKVNWVKLGNRKVKSDEVWGGERGSKEKFKF